MSNAGDFHETSAHGQDSGVGQEGTMQDACAQGAGGVMDLAGTVAEAFEALRNRVRVQARRWVPSWKVDQVAEEALEVATDTLSRARDFGPQAIRRLRSDYLVLKALRADRQPHQVLADEASMLTAPETRSPADLVAGRDLALAVFSRAKSQIPREQREAILAKPEVACEDVSLLLRENEAHASAGEAEPGEEAIRQRRRRGRKTFLSILGGLGFATLSALLFAGGPEVPPEALVRSRALVEHQNCPMPDPKQGLGGEGLGYLAVHQNAPVLLALAESEGEVLLHLHQNA